MFYHLSFVSHAKKMLYLNKSNLLFVLLLVSFSSGEVLFGQEISGTNESFNIIPGEAVEKKIAGKEMHSYHLPLEEHEFVNLELDPFPESLVLEVFAPDGHQLQQEWRLPEDNAPFELGFFAEEEGIYEVKIFLGMNDAPEDKYQLKVNPVSAAEVRKKLQNFQEVKKWINETAVPLNSVEVVDGTEDLMELKEVLQGVRVVGLGEATHGSKEFFQLKHRLLEFLVKEMEFTHFAIEGSQSAARAVNQFVLEGKGNKAEVLKNMGFWQWDTPEVAALIDWMHNYNKTVSEDKKVKFFGFDFQVNAPAGRDLIAFLNTVAPEKAAEVHTELEPLWKTVDHRPSFVEYYTFSKEQKDTVIQQVNELKSFMSQNSYTFTQKTSEEDYATALKNLKILDQFAVTYNTPGYDIKDPKSGVAMRDRFMAEHILEILEAGGRDAKIVVWSHNEHVKKDPYNMGYYLSEKLGKAYYAVGMGFDQGSFQAIELTDAGVGPVKEMTVGPAFQNSVEWFFRPSGIKTAFLDFRKAPGSGPVWEWLQTPLDMRSIGNGFYILNPGGYFRPPVKLGEAYDGLIYFDHVSRAISNSASQ